MTSPHLNCIDRLGSLHPNGVQRPIAVFGNQRAQFVDERFRIALDMTLAHLMPQPQVIGHAFEAIGIIAHQYLGSHTLRDGFDLGGDVSAHPLPRPRRWSKPTPKGYRPLDPDAAT